MPTSPTTPSYATHSTHSSTQRRQPRAMRTLNIAFEEDKREQENTWNSASFSNSSMFNRPNTSVDNQPLEANSNKKAQGIRC